MPTTTRGEPSPSWLFDSDNNKWYLEINSVRVAEIDSNGNMGIKGRAYRL